MMSFLESTKRLCSSHLHYCISSWLLENKNPVNSTRRETQGMLNECPHAIRRVSNYPILLGKKSRTKEPLMTIRGEGGLSDKKAKQSRHIQGNMTGSQETYDMPNS